MTNIYEFSAKLNSGEDNALEKYRGNVVLIVNTASKCGFTSQYSGLEELHRELGPRGLTVLGFPCNQFGQQEQGSNADIKEFCSLNYDVSFPLFAKIDVNGSNADPLYKYLKTAKPGLMGTESIKWNFTKFLVDREGRVRERYAPNITPQQIKADIEILL